MYIYIYVSYHVILYHIISYHIISYSTLSYHPRNTQSQLVHPSPPSHRTRHGFFTFTVRTTHWTRAPGTTHRDADFIGSADFGKPIASSVIKDGLGNPPTKWRYCNGKIISYIYIIIIIIVIIIIIYSMKIEDLAVYHISHSYIYIYIQYIIHCIYRAISHFWRNPVPDFATRWLIPKPP